MQQLLKQSTAATTIVGPILDSAGAVYTGAVIGDLNITKNGTTAAMAAAATLTHDHNGHYILVLTSGNTDTLGRLDITVNKNTYAMPPKVFEVLSAAMFDAIVTNGTLSTHTAADVWLSGSRTLTALDEDTTVIDIDGTTIGAVLGAVGSVIGNVGGNVVGSVASVTGNVGGNVVGSVASVVAAVATTSNVKKNQALANFEFLMTDSTNHAPATGLTVTCTRSIDGAAFGAGTLANIAEVANGIYKVDFGAGDLNGNVITLKATATGADTSFERVVTQP